MEPMGQLPPMIEMFKSLGFGLAVAVFVIFVLLTAYFQSPRLALISIGAVPGVLAGIATILYFTNTSLNIESFMGSIMCLGVSVSNSVMLVTFMDEHWKGGALGRSGHRRRGRTAAADPDDRLCDDRRHGADGAGAGAGSQMQAPLGLAVIGGLVMSTFATLLVLPSIFAMVIGKRWPTRRRSTRTTPRASTSTRTSSSMRSEPGHEDHDESTGHPARSTEHATVTHHQDDDALAFLRRILNEAREKRHDMVTHYTVDDLRVALGFAKPRSDDELSAGSSKHAWPIRPLLGKIEAANSGQTPGSDPDVQAEIIPLLRNF